MATNFPTSLDSFTNPVAGDSLASPSHAGQHADVNDAVEALQAKVGVGAHTLGEWTSFTPVFTNFTAGSASIDAQYCQINDIVFVVCLVTLAADSTVSGQIEMNHPVGSNVGYWVSGQALYVDAGTNTYSGALNLLSAVARLQTYRVNSTYAELLATSATVPFSWTTGDQFRFSYFYRK